MRAVLIDPAFLGDVVFDGPFARAFKALHPEGELGIVVRPPADAVARRLLGVDRVHVFDKRGAHRGLSGLSRVARELAAHRYDDRGQCLFVSGLFASPAIAAADRRRQQADDDEAKPADCGQQAGLA